MLARLAKDIGKRIFERFGYAIIPAYRDTRQTLCGLVSSPVRTVLDIGANRGQAAREFLRLFPEAKVYSFEPLPGPFKELTALAARSGGRLTAFNVALAARSGSETMEHHVGHDTSSSLLKLDVNAHEVIPNLRGCTSEIVQLEILDDLLRKGTIHLSSDTLMKLDVQGYELEVLSGASMVLSQTRSVIAEVGIVPCYKGQPTLQRLLDVLYSLGFEIAGVVDQHITYSGTVQTIDILMTRPARLTH